MSCLIQIHVYAGHENDWKHPTSTLLDEHDLLNPHVIYLII